MCEIATIAAVASIGGTIMGAVGQLQAGDAAAKAANYNAAVARNNQIIAEQQAQDALKRGQIAEDEQRRKTAQIRGAQRASLAASGVALDQGAPLDILGDTAAFGELDALTIRNNADREAYGYRVQGMNFAAEAGLADARAGAARQAGMIGAAGTLLSGAGTVMDRWAQRNKGSKPGGGNSPSAYMAGYSGAG